MKLVAEIKPISPFGYKSQHSIAYLTETAIRYGDIISVHTNPKWGGDFRWLQTVSNLTDKPILAKGIHATDDEVLHAFDCGATYVLVVDRIPDSTRLKHLMSSIWIEPNTLSGIDQIPPEIEVLVWNSRDLATGGFKTETIQEAKGKWSKKICQASNIKTPDDVEIGMDYIIVGENLVRFTQTL